VLLATLDALLGLGLGRFACFAGLAEAALWPAAGCLMLRAGACARAQQLQERSRVVGRGVHEASSSAHPVTRTHLDCCCCCCCLLIPCHGGPGAEQVRCAAGGRTALLRQLLAVQIKRVGVGRCGRNCCWCRCRRGCTAAPCWLGRRLGDGWLRLLLLGGAPALVLLHAGVADIRQLIRAGLRSAAVAVLNCCVNALPPRHATPWL
jgi:hypothetical protein